VSFGFKGLMKNVKSKARSLFTDEHFGGCMRIATTEMKPDINKEISKSSAKYLTND
jgi:hypothetical protein